MARAKKKKQLAELGTVWLIVDLPNGIIKEQPFEKGHAERILAKTRNQSPRWRLRDDHLEFTENAIKYRPDQQVSDTTKESEGNT